MAARPSTPNRISFPLAIPRVDPMSLDATLLLLLAAKRRVAVAIPFCARVAFMVELFRGGYYFIICKMNEEEKIMRMPMDESCKKPQMIAKTAHKKSCGREAKQADCSDFRFRLCSKSDENLWISLDCDGFLRKMLVLYLVRVLAFTVWPSLAQRSR